MMNTKQREHVNRIYRQLRLDADLTQLETAAKANIGETRYWKIENGYAQPTDDERKDLAKALRVSVEQLPSVDAVSA